MDKKAMLELWQQEEARTFSGWDFSYLEGRVVHETLPWDYDALVGQNLKKEDHLLDIGTGGGEYLLTLEHPYENTHVTEAYPPNIELCKERLGNLGIDVRAVDVDGWLPFEDHSMDIIINRHEYFRVEEVARVLKPGGIFITQQVGSWNNWSLSQRLVSDTSSRGPSGNVFELTVEAMKAIGFQIGMEQEFYPELKFLDIGALVYFAKIIQWEFPGFTVEGCQDQLFELQEELLSKGYLSSDEHRYVIVAKKL